MEHEVTSARRRNMQAVRSKDSKIEKALRGALWACGYRYRKHYSELVGKPDIVFVRHKVAVFCDSEFWHGFDWENRKNDFRTNKEFWLKKIQCNMERDVSVTSALERDGWLVLRFWGNEIRCSTEDCVRRVAEALAMRGGYA